MEEKFSVRDLRQPGWFWVANEFIDQVASRVGPKASLVYFALCRYSDGDQKCFPSIRTLAQGLGMRLEDVVDSIRKLEDEKVIEAERHPGKVTIYRLLDTKHWKVFRGVERCVPRGGTEQDSFNKTGTSLKQDSLYSTLSIDHSEGDDPQNRADGSRLEEGGPITEIRKWFHNVTGYYPRLNVPRKERETAERIRELAFLMGTNEMIRIARKAMATARERPKYLAYFIPAWESALIDKEFFCCGEKMRKVYDLSEDEAEVTFHAVCEKCGRSIYLYKEVQDVGR